MQDDLTVETSDPGHPSLIDRREPVKILFLCHDGGLYGSQKSLFLLLKHLPQDHIKPYVSIARPGPLEEILRTLPHVTLLTHQRIQWVKHDPRNLFQKLGDIVSLFLGLVPKTLALCQVIKQHKIQIVHTNSMVSLEGVLASMLTRIPHIWHIRELFMEKTPKLQPILGRYLTRWLIQTLSRRVLCISQAVHRQFVSQSSSTNTKIYTLYNAIEDDLSPTEAYEGNKNATIPPKNGAFRIGYIGRLSTGKRFQDLLEALYYLKTELNDPWELLVAGQFVDLPFEREVQTQLKTYDLKNHVTFLGYQSNLIPLYGSLDLLVVPSLNEPFGRVVIEGMQAGVPCIAANSGGIPEILTHRETGILYPPKDAVALKNAITETMTNADLRTRIRENARQRVRQRFTIKAQIDALLDHYQAVLRQRS